MYTLDYLENSCNLSDLKYILITLGGIPGRKNKSEIISEIMGIENGDFEPVKSNRGRPRNNSKYKRYDVVKQENVEIKVSDHKVKYNFGDKISGIVDLISENRGYVRVKGCVFSSEDVLISQEMVKRYALRSGDFIEGLLDNKDFNIFEVVEITSINGSEDFSGVRESFEELTPFYPDKQYCLSQGSNDKTLMAIDLFCPIGVGQRGIIIAPPKCGKTTLIKKIACAIEQNYPKTHLMCILIDEAPEYITDFKLSVHGEVIGSTFDQSTERHVKIVELAIERAKRLVEEGEDVFVIIDSFTKLAKSISFVLSKKDKYSAEAVSATSLLMCKKIFGSARNTSKNSLTILATAVSENGNAMDEKISEELSEVSNMKLKLSAELALKRIMPEIDLINSETLNCEVLQTANVCDKIGEIKGKIALDKNEEISYLKMINQAKSASEFIELASKK